MFRSVSESKRKKQSSRCANCNVQCDDGRLLSSELPKWTQSDTEDGPELIQRDDAETDTVDEKPDMDEDGSLRRRKHGRRQTKDADQLVTVLEALLKLFHFHWKYAKGLLVSTKREKDRLTMCSSCACSLSQMYDAYQKFSKSAITCKGNSHFHQLFSNLNFETLEDDDDQVSTSGQPAFDKTTQKSLKRIKTKYAGDIQSLLSCKVKLCKLTPESAVALAEADLDDFSLLERLEGSTLFGNQLNNGDSSPFAFEDAEDGDFELSMVKEDESESADEKFDIIQDLGAVKRRVGRPRKRPLTSVDTARLKRRLKHKSDAQGTDCAECGKKLRTNVLLRQHIRIYHQEHYDCRFCSERFSDYKQLKGHLSNDHEDEKTEVCSECPKRFFTALDLKKHGAAHVDRKTVICHLCNCSFPSERHLKAHQLTHTESEAKLPIYVCPVEGCGKRYTQAQFLHNHVRYLHERRNFFLCPHPGCDKSYGTESYLNAHVVSHDTVGSHLCELCGKNYKHKKDLRIHEQRYHSESGTNKEFACGVCPKRYFRADHLRTHRVKAQHYVGGQEPAVPDSKALEVQLPEEFKCSTCNKRFAGDLALKTHELTHDDNEDREELRKYACTDCDRKYPTAKALDYHKKYMHQLKSSFSCSFCSKSFGRLSSFKRHMTVHSNTQHICGNCSKSYKNKVDLMHHYRREHVLTEQGYEHECGVCAKKFYRRDMLRTHLVKTGHVAAKKRLPAVPVEVDEENVAVYVVETTDFGEEGAEKDDPVVADEGPGSCALEEMETGAVEGLNMEMVEITEDPDGTIAHVMVVNRQGLDQGLGTEVIGVMAESEEDQGLTMYNYSIRLE